jgi:hypothetical protein
MDGVAEVPVNTGTTWVGAISTIAPVRCGGARRIEMLCRNILSAVDESAQLS